MLKFCLPWPYAVSVIIQHTWVHPILTIWITFEPRMDQTVKPVLNLWTLKLDGAPFGVISSVWDSQHTLILYAAPIEALPGVITLGYSGPDENLVTNYNKQWEPWYDQLSIRVPYSWEDILVVDTANKRVGINVPTPLCDLHVLGAITSGTLTHSAVGPTDNLDVSDVNIVKIDCSANAVTIGGLVGGIDGQVLHIVKLCAAVNNVTLEHNEGGGNQDLFLHAGLDETLTGEYGGWTLACNGSDWYDISHAKHV